MRPGVAVRAAGGVAVWAQPCNTEHTSDARCKTGKNKHSDGEGGQQNHADEQAHRRGGNMKLPWSGEGGGAANNGKRLTGCRLGFEAAHWEGSDIAGACGGISYLPPDARLTVHAQKDKQDVPRVARRHDDSFLHHLASSVLGLLPKPRRWIDRSIGHGIAGSCMRLKCVNAADLLLILPRLYEAAASSAR